MSEVQEILDLIHWKRHRPFGDLATEPEEIAWELADLFKYVLCLAEIWDVSSTQLLQAVNDKTQALTAMRKLDVRPLPSNGEKVLVCDLDGTIADWRQSFIEWLVYTHHVDVDDDNADTLMIDNDLQWKYPEYLHWKEEFERNGGYATLHSYDPAINTVKYLQSQGVYLIIYTARPIKVRTVWWDTFSWLRSLQIEPYKLDLAGPERIVAAGSLQESCQVVMWDDDPENIIRAANSGIRVFARKHGYNAHIDHPLVELVEEYDGDISVYFPG